MPEHRFEPQPFGKYMLTERIGAGGMAEIFRATAYGVEGFTKEVCIKRILPTLTIDETFIRMFIAEAKIAVTLHHTNVVQVFDLGRIGEHYFIAMELVRGRDLLQIINRCRALKQRLPAPVALFLLSRVCQGLDYAHRVKSEGRPMGIIHRDVSPSNILVSWEGEVKVADFGIAKAAFKDEKTVTGTLKGKYGYMSPEQVQGDPVDHRSDIFAAGILLWESLAAKRLFKGATDLETLEKVRAAHIPDPPSKINKKVPAEVDKIVLTALALHPEDRYQTAAEFHNAIADVLFTSGRRIDNTALAAFMKNKFEDDILKEEEREKERSRPGLPPPVPIVTQDIMPLTPTPTPAGPVTRHDLPGGFTHVGRRPLSSVTIGIVASLAIVLVAATVVMAFWISNRPGPVESVDAGTRVPPTRPPAPRLGTLSVNSQPPGARIMLDGRDTGHTTPAKIRDLDRKRVHALRLDKEGHEPWSKRVEFGENEMVALDAELKLVPMKPPPKKPPPPKPRYGTLNVNAVPVWAYVYIDGKKQARPTPIYNLRLKPGSYEVRLVNPKLKLEKIRKITIKKGKSTDLVVQMR